MWTGETYTVHVYTCTCTCIYLYIVCIHVQCLCVYIVHCIYKNEGFILAKGDSLLAMVHA